MTENKRILSTILIILVVGLCFYSLREIGPGNIGKEEISSDDIMKHIRFLADDKRAGRYPGTRESRDVISYLINNLKSYGVQPGGERGSFKQTFSILDSVKLGENNSLSVNDKPMNLQEDYVPLWFSGNATLSSDIIFVGFVD